MNTLYYGDNLDIMREYIPDASVDLVYLDPPVHRNKHSRQVIYRGARGSSGAVQTPGLRGTG